MGICKDSYLFKFGSQRILNRTDLYTRRHVARDGFPPVKKLKKKS